MYKVIPESNHLVFVSISKTESLFFCFVLIFFFLHKTAQSGKQPPDLAHLSPTSASSKSKDSCGLLVFEKDQGVLILILKLPLIHQAETLKRKQLFTFSYSGRTILQHSSLRTEYNWFPRICAQFRNSYHR